MTILGDYYTTEFYATMKVRHVIRSKNDVTQIPLKTIKNWRFYFLKKYLKLDEFEFMIKNEPTFGTQKPQQNYKISKFHIFTLELIIDVTTADRSLGSVISKQSFRLIGVTLLKSDIRIRQITTKDIPLNSLDSMSP